MLENGIDSGDRTGTGTKSVFGRQVRFDLSQGFPMVTTKKTFWKGVVGELLWMLSGSTNTNDIPEFMRHWWTPWADEDGSLGPTYGQQFRNNESFFWVKPLLFQEEPDYDPKNTQNFTVNYDHPKPSDFLGKTIENGSGGSFVVIDQIKQEEGRLLFKIKFKNTGSEVVSKYGYIQNGKIKDPWAKTVFGVGMYGNCDYSDPHYSELVDTWREMLRRCYFKKANSYKSYGLKGVHVEPRWRVFEFFQKDVKDIPNWHKKIKEPAKYSLDKDILFASNRYSKQTCIWASKEEQSRSTSQNTPFMVTSPQGEDLIFMSLGELCKKHNLNISAVHRCLTGMLKTHKGWGNFRYLEKDGLVLRYRKVDQLADVISEIKNNPNSRRLNIALWNAGRILDMKLPPCHGNLIQFYVRNGKLSCSMYQRSADLFIGVPVNIAFYSLLTHLVANECGLQVGEFVHTFGDLHLYNNHIDQAKILLERKPLELPKLTINLKPGELMDFVDSKCDKMSWDEIKETIKLTGYKSHGTLKGDVSV